jgi:flagellar biosynthesis protein FliQ
MCMDAFEALLRETMLLGATLCVPVLAAAAIVGAVVAIAQAATQVQEQTLALLPKVLAVAGVVFLFGHAGLQACEQLFQDALLAIPSLVYGK